MARHAPMTKREKRTARIILLIVAAVLTYLYARHRHAIPVLLLGAGVGLIIGLLTGARYGRRPQPRAAPRKTAPPIKEPKITPKILSPECLPGSKEHGSCSGIGCDCGCGHPGNRSRVKTTPLDDEIPPY